MCAWHRGRPVGTLSDIRVRTRTGPQGPIPGMGKGFCPRLSLEGRGTRLQAGSALSRVQVPVCHPWAAWDEGSSACSAEAVFPLVGTGVILSPGSCLWETPSGHSLKVKLMVFLNSNKNACTVFTEPYLM